MVCGAEYGSGRAHHDCRNISEWSIGGDIYPFSIAAGPCYGHSVTEEFQGLCDYGLWITQQTTIAHVTLVTTPAKRFPRPVPMGISISPTPTGTPTDPNVTAGTAGMRVQSKSMPSQKFILSNNHVLGAIGPTDCPNTAHKGITWALQPGTLDIGLDPGNDPHYYVGTVANYVPQRLLLPTESMPPLPAPPIRCPLPLSWASANQLLRLAPLTWANQSPSREEVPE